MSKRERERDWILREVKGVSLTMRKRPIDLC